MKFKEKIKAHQEGKYDFATELLKLAQSEMVNTEMVCKQVDKEFHNEEDGHYTLTFRRWRPHFTPKKNSAEYKIAYGFKVILERHGRKAKNIKYTVNNGTQLERAIFDGEDYLYTVLTNIGYHYHVDDFDKIPMSVLTQIEKNFGEDYDGWYAWYKMYWDYINILRAVNRAKKKLIDEISPLILESLNDVLPHVDLSRKVDEVIGFIAIATKRKTYKKLTKILGTKVHQVGGEKYIVTTSNMKMKHTNIDKMLGVNDCKLTNNQYDFYDKLRGYIQKEIDKRNTVPFTFNVEGEITNINKRFFAQKMEIEESAFKKRLGRLQDKVDKDFFAKIG